MLYYYVAKYGWDNFKLGIIQYVDFKPEVEWQNKKEILLKIEQKYLDLLSPELNINKTAGSMLEFKHTKDNIKFKLDNKLSIKNEHNLSIKPRISQKTILKLKLHSKDIVVSIYDKNNELIKNCCRIRRK